MAELRKIDQVVDLIERGWVIYSLPGSYEVFVKAYRDDSIVTCVSASTAMGELAGILPCDLPQPGTIVYFVRVGNNRDMGVILTSVPKRTDPESKNIFAGYDCVPGGGVTAVSTDGYKKVLDNLTKKTQSRVIANNDRPIDVFPGDFLIAQRLTNVSLGVLQLYSFIKASEQCKIELFALDDMLRITSGYYQHFNAVGEFSMYNEGGRLSAEFRITNHQQEMFGYQSKDFKSCFKKVPKQKGSEPNLTGSDLEGDGLPDTLERMLFVLGDLGSMARVFVSAPSAGEPYRAIGDDSPNAGLMDCSLGKDGSLNISHAEDLILARNDKIPVPTRLKEAWEADSSKLTQPDEPNEPFNINHNDRWSYSLYIRDMVAWKNKIMMKPFTRRESWAVPEQGDAPAAPSEYDPIDEDKTDFDTARGRQSFIGQLKDGSILLRDAWGSEIYMRGGSIVITCPGEVQVKSGRSVIITSGKDICATAADSIDVTAIKGDARSYANGNIQIVANKKGVLLESLSTNEFKYENGGDVDLNFKEAEGKDVESGGIIIRAPEDRIFINSKVIHLASSYRIFVETIQASIFKAKELIKEVPEIIFSTTKFLLKCGSYVLNVGGGKAGIDINTDPSHKHGVLLYGDAINMYIKDNKAFNVFTNAGSSEGYSKINQAKFEYNDLGREGASFGAIYKLLTNTKKKEAKDYSKEAWLKIPQYFPYQIDDNGSPKDGASQRPYMFFTFRTVSQYATDKPGELECAPTDTEEMCKELEEKYPLEFAVYQASWEYMLAAKKDPRLGVCSLPSSGKGRPWPGYGPKDKVYKILEKELNVTETNGISKERNKLKNNAEELKKVPYGITTVAYGKLSDKQQGG